MVCPIDVGDVGRSSIVAAPEAEIKVVTVRTRA